MSRTELKTGPSNANQSAKKLLVLLETMSRYREPMRLYDLAQQCGMHPTTTLRFLTTLQSMGYVTQDNETSRYSLTHKICGLGRHLQKPTDIRNTALPYLRSLAVAFQARAALVIEDNLSILSLETAFPTPESEQEPRGAGDLADLHCTASGKLFLINYSQEQWDQLLAVKGLRRRTSHTITGMERLQKELILARINGFACDNEECEDGVCCVAAPIRDYTRCIIAALSVSGPSVLLTKPYVQSKLALLLEASAKISMHMGYDKSLDEGSMYRR